MTDVEIKERVKHIFATQGYEYNDETLKYYLTAIDKELLLKVIDDEDVNVMDFDRYIILNNKLQITDLEILKEIVSDLFGNGYEVLEMSDQVWPIFATDALSPLEITDKIIEIQEGLEETSKDKCRNFDKLKEIFPNVSRSSLLTKLICPASLLGYTLCIQNESGIEKIASIFVENVYDIKDPKCSECSNRFWERKYDGGNFLI